MTSRSRSAPLLETDDLATHFPVRKGAIRRRRVGTIRAVDGISLEVRRGETLGIVGESGCGKSTLTRSILGLLPITRGDVRFEGESVPAMAPKRLHQLRSQMQMVFQNPYGAFNPRMTVEEILLEPLRAQPEVAPSSQWAGRIADLMGQVGLDRGWLGRRPSQLSGGQLQRLGIARALTVGPDVLLCDEPVSALDVSIQAQVVNLLMDLQQATGIAIIFIAHDLAVVRNIADRVAIMYLGRVVEQGTVDEVYSRPRHPYTRALLSAVPVPDPDAEPVVLDRNDEMPSHLERPPGCAFNPRCWKAEAVCREQDPALEVRNGRRVACFFPETDAMVR